eukprot:scaffold39406_cov27-Attheya_sp.AAC.1
MVIVQILLSDVAVIWDSRMSIVFIESTFDTMVSTNYCIIAAEQTATQHVSIRNKKRVGAIGNFTPFPVLDQATRS